MSVADGDFRGLRHSWAKQPRLDDPTRSIYTCRRDGCGLKRRSDVDGGQRVQLWLWPDGTTGRGKGYPPCRGGDVASVEGRSGSAVVLAAGGIGAVADVPATLCARCSPPCGRPARLYPGGWSCEQVVAAAGARTQEWIRDMQTSGGAA